MRVGIRETTGRMTATLPGRIQKPHNNKTHKFPGQMGTKLETLMLTNTLVFHIICIVAFFSHQLGDYSWDKNMTHFYELIGLILKESLRLSGCLIICSKPANKVISELL